VIYDRYGGPRQLRAVEADRPEPRPDEVLVRVKAVALNAYDWHLLRGRPLLVRLRQGLFRPKNRILGADVAGVVEATGSTADRFQVGDEVFGCLEGSGTSGLAAGGLAEFVTTPETSLARIPAGLTFEQAAALPMAGGTALIAVRDCGAVAPGMNVLVNGASGGVGSFAVQIGRAFGARVTGVCATDHVSSVTSLGADAVIDYRTRDFTRAPETYDVIIDVAANRRVRDLKKALRPGGTIVSVGFSTMRRLVGFSVAARRKNARTRVVQLAADNWNSDHLRALASLVETGQVLPVIEREWDLDHVKEAFTHIETGHAGGKVILRIGR
jgi:NADPH:quinone reductase-like Zn-dependent oxidoreductase